MVVFKRSKRVMMGWERDHQGYVDHFSKAMGVNPKAKGVLKGGVFFIGFGRPRKGNS